MQPAPFRQALTEFIRANARPVDKFSHQPRLYALAVTLAEARPHDDDIVYAAVWLHDLGVFVGHRPEAPDELARWDNVAYAIARAPEILRQVGFPKEKIPAVAEVIRTHQPSAQPATFEGVLVRDADILEQLGAVGILRVVSKVGRDTRFARFSDALSVLRKNAAELPQQLSLDSARRLAQPRIEALKHFLAAAAAETGDIDW